MKKQSVMAVVGALKGLAYVIFLPLIGVFMVVMIVVRKLAITLRMAAKSSSPPQDSESPVPGLSSRR